MEKSRPRFVHSFPLISILIPYYDSAHKSFVLLSTLWKESRCNLNDFYLVFRRLTISSAEIVGIETHKFLHLPWDLFKFELELKTLKDWETFIKFVENINKRRGCYFEGHYMSEQIWIRFLNIHSKFIIKLKPYISLMKSIIIIKDSKEAPLSKPIESTLFDQAFLFQSLSIPNESYMLDRDNREWILTFIFNHFTGMIKPDFKEFK